MSGVKMICTMPAPGQLALGFDIAPARRPRRAKRANPRLVDINQLRRGITPAIRLRIFGPDDEPADCHYCGFPGFEIDHVVPASRGGGLDLENLVPVCLECNREKCDRTVAEWADWRHAQGKPWPIPSFAERLRFLFCWGIRPPQHEMVHGRMAMSDADYRQWRQLLMAARDHDLSETRNGDTDAPR
jgi:hypothetical protein